MLCPGKLDLCEEIKVTWSEIVHLNLLTLHILQCVAFGSLRRNCVQFTLYKCIAR